MELSAHARYGYITPKRVMKAKASVTPGRSNEKVLRIRTHHWLKIGGFARKACAILMKSGKSVFSHFRQFVGIFNLQPLPKNGRILLMNFSPQLLRKPKDQGKVELPDSNSVTKNLLQPKF